MVDLYSLLYFGYLGFVVLMGFALSVVVSYFALIDCLYGCCRFVDLIWVCSTVVCWFWLLWLGLYLLFGFAD